MIKRRKYDKRRKLDKKQKLWRKKLWGHVFGNLTLSLSWFISKLKWVLKKSILGKPPGCIPPPLSLIWFKFQSKVDSSYNHLFENLPFGVKLSRVPLLSFTFSQRLKEKVIIIHLQSRPSDSDAKEKILKENSSAFLFTFWQRLEKKGIIAPLLSRLLNLLQN